jgi:outer membrane protein TolC
MKKQGVIFVVALLILISAGFAVVNGWDLASIQQKSVEEDQRVAIAKLEETIQGLKLDEAEEDAAFASSAGNREAELAGYDTKEWKPYVAEAQVEAARKETRIAELNAEAEGLEKAVALSVANARLQWKRQLVDIAQRLVDMEKVRLDVGMSIEANLQDAVARLVQAEADQVTAEQEVEIARIVLAQQIKVENPAIAPMKEIEARFPTQPELETWIARDPQVIRTKAESERAEALKTKASEGFTVDDRLWKEKHQEALKALLNYEEAKQNAEIAIQKDWQRAALAFKGLETALRYDNVAEMTLKNAELKFNEGLISESGYLDSQGKRAEAQVNLKVAEAEYLSANTRYQIWRSE